MLLLIEVNQKNKTKRLLNSYTVFSSWTARVLAVAWQTLGSGTGCLRPCASCDLKCGKQDERAVTPRTAEVCHTHPVLATNTRRSYKVHMLLLEKGTSASGVFCDNKGGTENWYGIL